MNEEGKGTKNERRHGGKTYGEGTGIKEKCVLKNG
jgi:hypothetical protein